MILYLLNLYLLNLLVLKGKYLLQWTQVLVLPQGTTDFLTKTTQAGLPTENSTLAIDKSDLPALNASKVCFWSNYSRLKC